MAFPRLLALAEVAWTPQGDRDWEDFRARLAAEGRELDALGVAVTSARPRSTGPERHRFAKTAVTITVSGRASTTEQPRRVPVQPPDQRTKRGASCGARRELHDRSEREVALQREPQRIPVPVTVPRPGAGPGGPS